MSTVSKILMPLSKVATVRYSINIFDIEFQNIRNQIIMFEISITYLHRKFLYKHGLMGGVNLFYFSGKQQLIKCPIIFFIGKFLSP